MATQALFFSIHIIFMSLLFISLFLFVLSILSSVPLKNSEVSQWLTLLANDLDLISDSFGLYLDLNFFSAFLPVFNFSLTDLVMQKILMEMENNSELPYMQ